MHLTPKKALTIFCLAILTACHHDDERKTSAPLLTIDASQRNDLGRYDNWFLIADKAGKVLDFKRDSVAKIISLDAMTQDDTISLTWIQNSGTVEVPIFTIWSYGAIPVHSSLSINQPDQTELPSVTGSFQVTITDQVDPSTVKKVAIAAPFVFYSTSELQSPSQQSFDLYGDTVSVFASGYSTVSGPVYKSFHGVKNGDNVSFDYSDLKPFANTVDLPANTTIASTKGFKSSLDDGITFSDVLNYPSGDYTRKSGYIPGYDAYSMVLISSHQHDVTTMYIKNGTINLHPVLPSVSATKLDLSLQHPDIRVDRPANLQQLSWYRLTERSPAQWYMISPYRFQIKLTELPSEFTSLYPLLDITDFRFSGAYLSEIIGEWNYKDFLQNNLTNTGPGISESYNYQVY